MKINYKDANGQIIELEVSDDVGTFYLESVEAEKSNDRRNSRPGRHVTVRERLLRLLLGDKRRLTVIVPGDSVKSLSIVEEGGENREQNQAVT